MSDLQANDSSSEELIGRETISNEQVNVEEQEISIKQEEGQEAVKAAKHCTVSKFLNKYFHHIDRGGSLRSEVTAGILMCILAVCGMFVNMQLIIKIVCTGSYAEAAGSAATLAANGELVAAIWFMSMLIAFLGSMAIGLIARLPFVQVSGLGLSSVLISLMGSSNGLTYYNLLAISLISSVVYTVLVSVPKVKSFLKDVIPASIKKAVPIAFGVLLVFVAMQLSGLFTINGSLLSAYGTGTELASTGSTVGISSMLWFNLFNYESDRFHPTLLLSCLSVVLAFVLILVFKSRKAKHPYLWSLLISQGALIIFQVLCVAINWDMMVISFDSLFGRAWMIGSEDAMQLHLGKVFANLSVGAVFTKGFDFSAYSGNAFLLFVTGILTMSASYSLSNHAVMTSTAARSGFCSEKANKLALICNAGTNVVASVFCASPIAIGVESVAGAEDNAKSGISSIVAALGFFVSMFIWIIPAVFLTTSSSAIQMNLYGHYGKVLQLLTECSFGIADGVIAVVGLSMIKSGLGEIDWRDAETAVVSLAVIVASFFFGNLVYGVCVGMILYTVGKMLRKPNGSISKLGSLKEIGWKNYTVCGVCLLLLLLAYFL